MAERKQDRNRVLIVIPAYNEEKTLDLLTREIARIYPRLDILVVDDGSDVAPPLPPGVRVVRHPFNLGDGAARQTGFLYALRHGYDFVIHLDADRQHSPREIPVFLDALEEAGADLVVGSRFIGACTYRVPAARRLGMRIFGLACSIFTGKRITDPTNGFRGMNRKALRLYTRGFYPQHFPDADVIVSSHYGGLRIVEVPVTVGPTRSVNLHRGWRILYYIYKMFLSTFVAILGRREKTFKGAERCPSNNN